MFYMFASFLIGYYLHQFTVPSTSVLRSVQPAGNVIVEAFSPRSGSVAPGSQRIEMLTLQITADCTSAVSINTISVQRRGLGANEDIESLYITKGTSRISRERSIAQRDGSVDLQLRDFSIPACETVELSVVANYSEDASPAGEHRIELRSIDAGKSTVRIERSTRNVKATQRTASQTVGQVSVEYLRLTQSVRYGSRQLLSRFTLEADNRDDHNISAMTFTNNGSATDQDIRNLYIEFRSRRISSYARSLDGDKVVFTFNPPIQLQANQTLKFGLRGDVQASRSRTIQFIVEEPSDIISTPARTR